MINKMTAIGEFGKGGVAMDAEGLILAGGKSLRMGGRHKGSLTYENETFTQLLRKELKKEVSCVWLSYGQEIQENHSECPIVMDVYPNCGPIGGLYSGLRACTCDWMLIAACDMPFLKIELFRYLKNQLQGKKDAVAVYDGVVPVTGGCIHPLAAIYQTKIGDVLKVQLEEGDYRVRNALKRLNILYADVTGMSCFEEMLQNINTMEEYTRLRWQDRY